MDNLKNIADFFSQVKAIDGPWREKRLAFKWTDGHTYLINDNIAGWNRYDPNLNNDTIGWTAGQVIQFLKSIDIEPFEIEVEVKEA